MSAFFIASYVVLWLLVVILVVMVVLLYRQFGLMLMPGRRRADLQGLDLGSRAPKLQLQFRTSDTSIELDWAETSSSPRLAWAVMFASPFCAICEGLWKSVAALPAGWPDVEFVWIEDGARQRIHGEQPAGWTFATSAEGFSAGEAMDVGATPYLYVIQPGGRVAAKGLVNSSAEISSTLLGAFADEGAAWTIPNDGTLLSQSDLSIVAHRIYRTTELETTT